MVRSSRLLLLTLSLLPSSLAESVSIDDDIPYDTHECVDICLDSQGSFQNEEDIGQILSCGSPYAEECYCATPTASASAVSAFINDCAGEYCAAGDMDRDISIIRGLYASYCRQAGFTQPIVSAWYTGASGPEDGASAASTAAEPSQTGGGSGAPQTVTDTTLVTHTVASEDGASGSRGELLLFLLALVVPAAVITVQLV